MFKKNLIAFLVVCVIILTGSRAFNQLREIAPFNLLVSMGGVSQAIPLDKFGENPDIDTGTVPEDIWEHGGVYNFTANTGANYYVSSTSALDTQELEFQVLTVDANNNWNLEVFMQNLAGQTKTLLVPPSGDLPVRIFRIQNNADTGGDINGVVHVYEDTTVSGGEPDDTTKVRASIDNGNNQTLMALYTIPTGYVGFLMRGEVGLSRSQTSGAVQAAYRSRRYGKVFKIKKRVDITNSGTSAYQDLRAFPDPIPARTDIVLRVEEVSANNASVFGTFDILLMPERYLSKDYKNAIGQVERVK